MADCDYLYKIILIGDINVGKTSIVRRFRDGAFDDTYRTTIGVDFAIRTLDIDNKQVKLQIWDTSGQERFRSITTSYFRNAHGIVLVYDITNRTSLEVAERWLMDVNRLCGDSPVNLLVGNKSDLIDRRQVTIQEAKTFAANHGMIGPIETSAKSAANIDQAFYSLAQELVQCNGASSHLTYNQEDSILLHQTSPQPVTWWSCCGYT
ncbi:ras-related protein Rab-19-like [Mizuhopecten yessoensis]|uniref:Ras-related protein Rab-19 n=1 Tax=Mizuhopecten yessoensis TaxID=6573 RepID=A0A210R5R8_MIZYE|nr:ras-related protein Rab-19-like [Mizuhopecten yessoensis]OWF56238.1 Ras-related protein Rab-19 [Mizuhopecten yessoensis]